MRLALEYTSDISTPVSESLIRNVVEQSLQRGGSSFLSEKYVSIEVILVDRTKIRSLNTQYRDKDAETDVLSFGDYMDREALRAETSTEIFLGQVFVCYDYVADAAVEDSVSIERELAYIVSHGVLHLLGYDHEEEMFAIQDDIAGAY